MNGISSGAQSTTKAHLGAQVISVAVVLAFVTRVTFKQATALRVQRNTVGDAHGACRAHERNPISSVEHECELCQVLRFVSGEQSNGSPFASLRVSCSRSHSSSLRINFSAAGALFCETSRESCAPKVEYSPGVQLR